MADGSIVDVWGRKEEVDWRLPGAGAPCTSTARPGRWRSFPYLAELQGEDGEALWSYLCRQWDRENDVEHFPGRKLINFNFFMLQADVLPNMGFSATRKRLIHSYECVKSEDDEEPLFGTIDQPNNNDDDSEQRTTQSGDPTKETVDNHADTVDDGDGNEGRQNNDEPVEEGDAAHTNIKDPTESDAEHHMGDQSETNSEVDTESISDAADQKDEL